MMARGLTVCIVGAGSSYTPELVEGLLAIPPERLPVGAVNLTDIDSGRLGIMSGLTQRMVAASRRDVLVRESTSLKPMLEGADFVVTQIRVGGMSARHLDESIPPRYGVIGQETTGPGGMFKALRTIPAMLDIARAVTHVCPDAFILNYTNPSGIITEAVSRHTEARIMGLCSGIPAVRRAIAERLKHDYPDLRTYCVGLNHLGFVHRMISNGMDVTREAIERLCSEVGDDAAMAECRAARLLGAVPIGYVDYFLHHGKKVSAARKAPRTRAQVVEELEQETLAEAASPTAAGKPKALAQRGGSGYSEITLAVMSAIHNDAGAELVASVPNAGAVMGIEDDAVVEVVCRIDGKGAAPLRVGPIPIAFRGLVLAVKAYETLTVEAALTRDRRLMIQALVNHPLVGDLDIIEPLVDEMLAAHGPMEEDT